LQAIQTAVMPMDWALFTRSYPAFAADPFLEEQTAATAPDTGSQNSTRLSPQLLRGLEPEARAAALLAYLQVEAARVLGLAPERMETDAPLPALGFDSLMAVQLKNRIEADTGAVVPMIQFLQGLSVEQLVVPVLEAVEAMGAVAVTAGAPAEVWEEGTL